MRALGMQAAAPVAQMGESVRASDKRRHAKGQELDEGKAMPTGPEAEVVALRRRAQEAFSKAAVAAAAHDDAPATPEAGLAADRGLVRDAFEAALGDGRFEAALAGAARDDRPARPEARAVVFRRRAQNGVEAALNDGRFEEALAVAEPLALRACVRDLLEKAMGDGRLEATLTPAAHDDTPVRPATDVVDVRRVFRDGFEAALRKGHFEAAFSSTRRGDASTRPEAGVVARDDAPARTDAEVAALRHRVQDGVEAALGDSRFEEALAVAAHGGGDGGQQEWAGLPQRKVSWHWHCLKSSATTDTAGQRQRSIPSAQALAQPAHAGEGATFRACVQELLKAALVDGRLDAATAVNPRDGRPTMPEAEVATLRLRRQDAFEVSLDDGRLEAVPAALDRDSGRDAAKQADQQEWEAMPPKRSSVRLLASSRVEPLSELNSQGGGSAEEAAHSAADKDRARSVPKADPIERTREEVTASIKDRTSRAAAMPKATPTCRGRAEACVAPTGLARGARAGAAAGQSPRAPATHVLRAAARQGSAALGDVNPRGRLCAWQRPGQKSWAPPTKKPAPAPPPARALPGRPARASPRGHPSPPPTPTVAPSRAGGPPAVAARWTHCDRQIESLEAELLAKSGRVQQLEQAMHARLEEPRPRGPSGATGVGPAGAGAAALFQALGHRVAGHLSVRLLRLSWLLSRPGQPAALPCRQALPEEAFVGAEELERVWEASGYGGAVDGALPVVAFSLCWDTPQHPDPEGVQLGLATRALARQASRYRRACGSFGGFSEVGVFWDWGSLLQERPVEPAVEPAPEEPQGMGQRAGGASRTPEEKEAYDYALRETMDLWYAHAGTTVFLLTQHPKERRCTRENGHEASGWTTFERCSAELVKRTRRHEAGWKAVVELAGAADVRAAERRWPVGPDEFDELIEARAFSVATDRHVVKGLFRRTCESQLSVAEALDLEGMRPPTAREAAGLGGCLALCARLRALELHGTPLSEAACAALFGRLPQGALPSVRRLVLSGSELGAAGLQALLASLAQEA
ncbi:unnamed protein product, partial [Prorocentrum cordatum]